MQDRPSSAPLLSACLGTVSPLSFTVQLETWVRLLDSMDHTGATLRQLLARPPLVGPDCYQSRFGPADAEETSKEYGDGAVEVRAA